jgi:hypothetical protein
MALGAIIGRIKALFKEPKNTSQDQDGADDRQTDVGILSDRTSFKLYAAQNHLSNLKDIQHKHGHIMGRRRIGAEMELDCYFAQIIGAKDLLLMRINEKVGLGINDKDVNLDVVYERLKSQGKEDLVKELKSLSTDKTSWFWLLNELRNHSIHRNMLRKKVSVSLFEDVNTGTSGSSIPENYSLVNPLDEKKTAMNTPIVQYLEESLSNMKSLVDKILNSPLMK